MRCANSVPRKTVTVNDRMQRNYRYERTAPVGQRMARKCRKGYLDT